MKEGKPGSSRIKHIASSDNKLFRKASSLATKKYRDREGLYLVEGENLVEEAIASSLAETILIRDDRRDYYDRFAERDISSVFLKGDLFRKIAQTETSQGIACMVRKPDNPKEALAKSIRRKGANLLVLDGLQDPGNLGTMLRTAAAAGYKGALLMKGTVDVYSPKVVRAAAGAIFRLPIYQGEGPEETIAFLKEAKKKTVGTTPRGGILYTEADLTKDIALVIGNEGNGMSPEMTAQTDFNVYLPMVKGMESLNAAVAAGILMYRSRE